MPFFDGTGPRGQGPMTGRGMGPCGGSYGFGRRGWFGRGRGYGRGWGYGPGFLSNFRAPTKTEEREYLEEYKKDLEAELASVEKELKDLN